MSNEKLKVELKKYVTSYDENGVSIHTNVSFNENRISTGGTDDDYLFKMRIEISTNDGNRIIQEYEAVFRQSCTPEDVQELLQGAELIKAAKAGMTQKVYTELSKLSEDLATYVEKIKKQPQPKTKEGDVE